MKHEQTKALWAAVEKRIRSSVDAIALRVDNGDEFAAFSLANVRRVKLDRLCSIVVQSIQNAANELISDSRIRAAAYVRLASFWPLTWHEGRATHDEHFALVALQGQWGHHNATFPEVWPADITPEDLAIVLDASNDGRARWIARAIRQGIVWRYEDGSPLRDERGQVLFSDDGSIRARGLPAWPRDEQFVDNTPRDALDALQFALPAVCVARAVTHVRRDQRVPFTPIPSTHHARTTTTLVSGRAPGIDYKRERKASFVLECGPYDSSNIPRGELEFSFPSDIVQASDAKRAILSILARDRESGLHDWLALHVLASRAGQSGQFVWTWEAHREITPWGARIKAKNITDRDALREVSERLHRWEKGILKAWLPRDKGKKDFLRLGGTLLELTAGTEDASGRIKRAAIKINSALYLEPNGRHYTHIDERALHLDAETLRVCVAVMFAARDARDDGGMVNCRAQLLWDSAGIEPTNNVESERLSKKNAAIRDERARRSLDTLSRAGIIGTWEAKGAEGTPDRHYEIAPSTAWIDRTVHGIPPAPLAVAMLASGTINALPSTGDELRAWREAQGDKGITQAQAAAMLGVNESTIRRAEKRGSDTLSRALIRALIKGKP